MKFLAGMFGHRAAAPATPEPLPPASRDRADREREAAERDAERRRASREREEREREAARRDAERRQAGIDEIRRACAGPARYWWPGEVAPESRLSGRPTWRERVVAALTEGFRR